MQLNNRTFVVGIKRVIAINRVDNEGDSKSRAIEIFFIARFYVEPHGGSRAGRAMNCATTNRTTWIEYVKLFS